MQFFLSLFFIFYSLSIFSEENNFTDTEKYLHSVDKCSKPSHNYRDKKSRINFFENEKQIDSLIRKFYENRDFDNISETVKIYELIEERAPQYKSRINKDGFLVYENFDFKSLNNEEFGTFADILIKSHVCDSFQNIQVMNNGNCIIKLSKKMNSCCKKCLENTNINIIENKPPSDQKQDKAINHCKESVTYYAVYAATKKASTLVNAASVSGCLLAIDGIKQCALSLCENNPKDWFKITEPFRKLE